LKADFQFYVYLQGRIRLSHAGPSHAKLPDLRASDPVLVVAQYVRHANGPFYLAKCLMADRPCHLSLMQSLHPVLTKRPRRLSWRRLSLGL
jgi:hypothetical protein